jgi:hypothetical protein
MEVGSFLDRPSLTVCTTQLCWSGVGFVSRPYTDSAEVTTIQLHNLVALCPVASRTLRVGQEQSNGLATEAVKRIDLCLARRNSAEKVVFIFDLTEEYFYAKANKDFYESSYPAIYRHYSLSSNLQFNNGPSLAVEWHAHAKSIDAVALLGQSLHTLDLMYTEVRDISVLASCQALHTLYLHGTQVSDVSVLASCQALHTLNLNGTKVSDLSALASCQALHTLDLSNTEVHDISALASCQALHTLNLEDTEVSDVSVLASCQALHTLDLFNTDVSDVSALASCQALHTLYLFNTDVSDVSALASCQALHTLHLGDTQVNDISALAACGSLRNVYGCKQMQGYGAIARLIENRTLQAQGV